MKVEVKKIFFILLAVNITLFVLHEAFWFTEAGLWRWAYGQDVSREYCGELLLRGELYRQNFTYTYPPLSCLIIGILMKIFGRNILIPRLLTSMFLFLTSLLLVKIEKRTVYLMPFIIIFLQSYRFADAMLYFLVVLSYYFFKREKYGLSGVFSIISLFTKQLAVFFALPFFINLVLKRDRKKLAEFLIPFLAIGAVSAIFLQFWTGGAFIGNYINNYFPPRDFNLFNIESMMLLMIILFSIFYFSREVIKNRRIKFSADALILLMWALFSVKGFFTAYTDKSWFGSLLVLIPLIIFTFKEKKDILIASAIFIILFPYPVYYILDMVNLFRYEIPLTELQEQNSLLMELIKMTEKPVLTDAPEVVFWAGRELLSNDLFIRDMAVSAGVNTAPETNKLIKNGDYELILARLYLLNTTRYVYDTNSYYQSKFPDHLTHLKECPNCNNMILAMVRKNSTLAKKLKLE